ncbi:MAG: hypothetical protein NTZ09_02695 [Candidatus Hydrogenedentes bacterium]|nr:hypothetical protein [Candidatus Hydrogenedentota bacterium]
MSVPEESNLVELVHVLFPPKLLAGPYGDFLREYLVKRDLWTFEEVTFWFRYSDSKLVAAYNASSWEIKFGMWRAEMERLCITPPEMNELRRDVARGRLNAVTVDGQHYLDPQEVIKWWARQWIPRDFFPERIDTEEITSGVILPDEKPAVTTSSVEFLQTKSKRNTKANPEKVVGLYNDLREKGLTHQQAATKVCMQFSIRDRTLLTYRNHCRNLPQLR